MEKIEDIGYFNARVRGLKAGLVGMAELDVFLKTDSAEKCLEGLKATLYARHMGTSAFEGGNAAYSIIERSLLRGASDAFGFIWSIAPDAIKPFIKAMLAPYEAYNLKAVLRGLARGIKREEIRTALVPAGEFDGAALDALVGAKDLSEAVSMLAAWASPYARPFEEAVRQRPLALFEAGTAIGKFAFEHALNSAQGKTADAKLARQITAWRIDTENIMTLFNLCAEASQHGAPDYFFIPGGERLDKGVFISLSGVKSPAELLDGLADAITDKEWAPLMEGAYPGEPELLENALDRALEKKVHMAAVIGQADTALVASYLFRKAGEIKKIRFIARSKACNMPPESLRRYIA